MALVQPEQKVAKCEEVLGLTFQKKQLCLEALQMNVEPVLWNNRRETIGKNDRLAVLGNNMMRAYFCKQWYDSGRAKGLWSLAEQEILKTANLADVGFEKGLEECILVNKSQKVTPNMMATSVQALIGAVYVEEGETGMAKVLAKFGLKHEYLDKAESMPAQQDNKN